jgi:serine/threonine protein kinase
MTTPDDHPLEQARFRETALASGLVTEGQLAAAEATIPLPQSQTEPAIWDQALADRLVETNALTKFQAREILAGRRRFRLGQYTIFDEVARGGMGQVFRAEHAMMGREVAVKVLPRAKSTPESEAAFRREMRMLGRLDHVNLVRAFDAGYDAMVYYLVTEYVPGLDLKRQVLKHGPLPEPLAASVISQAARGLAYAHEQGLVHRDVKPGNILVMPDGRVKVLDLGLAGSQIEEESSRLGRVVGTMDYISPEQIRAPDDVGPSADIYSLGCTLYFAVTGRVPFPGGTRREKMQRHLTDTPVPPAQLAPHLSAGFCRVIEDMLAKDPAKRIQSAPDVIERLRRWTPETLAPMPRRKRSSKATESDGSSDTTEETSRGSWLPWPRDGGSSGQQSDGDPLWTLPDEPDGHFEPPPPATSSGLSERLRAFAGALFRSIIGAVLFAAVVSALRHFDPNHFGAFVDSSSLVPPAWVVFGFLLVVQFASVANRR